MDGGTFLIFDRQPGTVWLRQSGEWVKPPTSENDPRSEEPWPDDQTAIAPTRLQYYGKVTKWTYVTAQVFTDLRDAINLMTDALGSFAWSAYSDAAHTTQITSGYKPGGYGTQYRNICGEYADIDPWGNEAAGAIEVWQGEPYAVLPAWQNATVLQYPSIGDPPRSWIRGRCAAGEGADVDHVHPGGTWYYGYGHVQVVRLDQ